MRTKLEQASSFLGLVLEAPPALDTLTDDQLTEVIEWASFSHCEASDNNVYAGAAPTCLLALLPSDHYLQLWRLGLINNPYGLCEWEPEDVARDLESGAQETCGMPAVGSREYCGDELSVCAHHMLLEIPGEHKSSRKDPRPD